jgi:cystathionine beta-lyase
MKDQTLLNISGREPQEQCGLLNPPIYSGSTVTYPDFAAYERRKENYLRGVVYGTVGTPTTNALAQTAADLEGGAGAVVCSSGLAAVSLALTAVVKAGDHVLMTDSVYGPGRTFCQEVLSRFGVETTFFDPMIGEEIADLMRPETTVVYLESPGTFTFEVQDVPAIAKAAHEKGALVLLDNTWSAGIYFKPFEHGVDLSIQAATKYQSGHGDLVIGWITAATEELFARVKTEVCHFGDIASPHDCWLTLRGMRSMAARLKVQQEAGLELAGWLQDHPKIKRILHPALPGCPGHEIWKRDFTGASSLFGILLDSRDEQAQNRMIEGMRYFRLGASWGGYQSLIMPAWLTRDVAPAPDDGLLIRLAVGLEHVDDLKQDLSEALDRI